MTAPTSQSSSASDPRAGLGGLVRFWAWAGVRLTAGGFMAGRPAS